MSERFSLRGIYHSFDQAGRRLEAVCYTHLTLPPICSVELAGGAV